MKKIKNSTKIIIHSIFIIAFIIVLLFELSYGKNNLGKEKITYSKESELNYKTYLKDNSHYNNNYLENDYNYVANLIDYFNLDFSYSYVIGENIDYKLEYDVTGYLEVYDSDNTTKPIERKEYKILDTVTDEGKGQVIKVDLYNQKIYYEDYNKVVQAWKKELNPSANLKITFKVNWSGYSEILGKEVSDSYTNTFEIPISEKIITISKPAKVNDSGFIYGKKSLSIIYIGLIIITAILLLVALIGLVLAVVKINKSKSKYEQKIKKILREFDRAITEAKGRFKIERGEKAIEVREFMELMDVHDNLHEPIIYYKTSVNKCTFVVRNGKDIYYTVITRDECE